jgi:hypothetical protein
MDRINRQKTSDNYFVTKTKGLSELTKTYSSIVIPAQAGIQIYQ